MMRKFPALIVALSLGLPGFPALAQDYTDQELLQLFQTQRDAFRAASESPTGKTRGLSLVTLDNVDAATEAPILGSTPDAGTGSAVATAPGTDGGVNTGAAGTQLGAAPLPDTGVTVGTAPSTPRLQPLDTPEQVVPAVFGKLDQELQVNVRIQFAFDSAALADDQKPRLEQLCRVMKESDINKFRIVGHTDASGSDDYNQQLSILRAEEVQRYFTQECGIRASRLEAVGMGERFLFNEDDPRAGENRRVEFQALS